jgi:hypothetical protein
VPSVMFAIKPGSAPSIGACAILDVCIVKIWMDIELLRIGVLLMDMGSENSAVYLGKTEEERGKGLMESHLLVKIHIYVLRD